MITGTAVSIIGYGLLTTIGIDSPTVLWATYLTVCGIGMGTGMNVPYTALQAVLRYLNHSPLESAFILTFSKVTTISPREMVRFSQRLLKFMR